MERAPFADVALHPHETSVLRHDAVRGREAEARALARVLGREERVEAPCHSGRVHPGAGVRHADPGPPRVSPRRAIVGVGRLEVAEPDGQGPAVGHRVVRVDRDVDDDLLELTRVDADEAAQRPKPELEPDIVAEQGAEDRQQPGDQVGRVDQDLGEDLPAAEREQLAGDLDRPVGGRQHLVHVAPDRVAVGQRGTGELGVAADGGQEVVEVVGHAAREQADRLEPLGLDEVGVEVALRRHVADIQHGSREHALDGHDRAPGQQRLEFAPVGPAEPDLDALAGALLLPVEEPRHRAKERLVEVVGDRAAEHGVLRRPEEPGHRAVRVGRAAVRPDEPHAVVHAVEDQAQPVHRHLAHAGVEGPLGGLVGRDGALQGAAGSVTAGSRQ